MIPAALVVGIVGIVRDRRKALAVAATVIAAASAALFLVFPALMALCD